MCLMYLQMTYRLPTVNWSHIQSTSTNPDNWRTSWMMMWVCQLFYWQHLNKLKLHLSSTTATSTFNEFIIYLVCLIEFSLAVPPSRIRWVHVWQHRCRETGPGDVWGHLVAALQTMPQHALQIPSNSRYSKLFYFFIYTVTFTCKTCSKNDDGYNYYYWLINYCSGMSLTQMIESIASRQVHADRRKTLSMWSVGNVM